MREEIDMGTIQNNVIVVTGYDRYIEKANEKARDIFSVPALGYVSKNLVTPIMWHITNQEGTFMIAPDGSKLGWDLADEFTNRRREYTQWLKKIRTVLNGFMFLMEKFNTKLQTVTIGIEIDSANKKMRSKGRSKD